jgi:threonine dehydratase
LRQLATGEISLIALGLTHHPVRNRTHGIIQVRSRRSAELVETRPKNAQQIAKVRIGSIAWWRSSHAEERERLKGERVGVILSGGNIDRALHLRLLGGS